MSSKEEQRKITLDHMIDEKFAEIFFIAKEEFEIENKSGEEVLLYEFLNNFKILATSGIVPELVRYQND